MGTTYDDFLYALRFRESTNNYSLVNAYGYLGAYQFGEAALVELGIVRADGNDYDNNYSGGWTGRFGIDSRAEFLATPSQQEAAIDAWWPIVWDYLTGIGADAYVGQYVGGIHITSSGILAGAHLLGFGAVMDWLESGGSLGLTDVFGTPISEYIGMFSGYTMPFPTADMTLDDIAGVLAALPGDQQARISNIYDQGGAIVVGENGVNGDLHGYAGFDVVVGMNGDDRLLGKRNDDALIGGDGNDLLKGGRGSDLLLGGDGNDLIRGGSGNDSLYGGAMADTLLALADNDTLYGEGGDDVLGGGSGNDTLYGGVGNDLLRGFLGDDWLEGEAGNDILRGHQGNDVLHGGTGDDRMTGHRGGDVFVFKDGDDRDIVRDFDASEGDRIRLTELTSITSFSDLMTDHADQVGADVVIDAGGGDTLTLLNVQLDTLTSLDFEF